MGVATWSLKDKEGRTIRPNHMKNKDLALTRFRAGLLVLLGVVVASVFVAQAVNAHKERRHGKDKAERILIQERHGPFLGVKMQELSEALSDGLDTKVKKGVLVTEVIEGSPAERAGLEDGDIIVEFDGNKVNSPDELQSLVGEADDGDEVKIKVVRGKKSKTLKVTLGDWEDHPTFGFLRDFDFEAPHVESFSHYANLLRPRRLGVHVSELNGDLAPYFGVKAGEGLLVLEVSDESTAEEAGVKAGDVIVKVEGEDIRSTGDIHEQISELDAGDEVNITVVRKKKTMELKTEMKEGGRYWFQSGRGRAPRARAFSLPHIEIDEDIRKELDELRKEIEELKKELKKS